MFPIINTKNSFLYYPCLFLLLLSCNQDADLLLEQALENEEVSIVDDNFKIPLDKISILDVLSNDNFASNNVRIIETSSPLYGSITINEDNTITYIPRETNSNSSSEEHGTEGTGSEETGSEEETNEETGSQETNNQEDTSSEETTSEQNTAEDTTEENNDVETSNEEDGQDNLTTEESSEESTEQSEEDTFTYTIEVENEDGATITETGTVTVDIEPDPESTPEQESEAEPDSDSEYDYWREPVIEGTRLVDEKYYNLDTEEVSSKNVNLQRGQVENYVEHENCPQRIKNKWANRIEITPNQVNGKQNGLQEIFDAHPKGSLFYLRAGTYKDQKNAVLKNDQDIVGEYKAILDGSGIQGNSEESTRAIRSMERGFICNLKVQNYPTWNDPKDSRAPRGAALEVIQNGAILNCEVHSENRAIALIYGSKAMWNKVTAGRLGIYGYGSHDPNSPNRRGAMVKYNEIYNCNFNDYDGEHEAGAAKFVQVDGVLWSHNYIHNIPSGGGIWQDGDNRESEVYNNVIIKTHRSIFSELAHTSDVHHNTIEYGTGFGAVYMSNSQDEKVHHNFIRWCRNGITIRDKERGTSKIYAGKAWRGINNVIYNNHIWQRPDPSTWTHGVATLFDGHIDPNNTTNKWYDNHYYVDDNAEGAVLFSQDEPFKLVFMYSKLAPDSDHKTITWEEWKNKSGDTNSVLEYRKYF
ncbi:hypothetical protein FEE95_02940 [Maribacter algarum]|uniref:Right handed beta helix domain-containing protein n=1 Tax=Maribacter algarum (ex Zhang et al. 2020) TaxID=2578118 RepID=A0A5S3PTV3_9FLAO|nr:right-handed parallel beta-helix repeat-containing protein [Maribacter algarum]TMM58403.1 hypothetical protein FEE95_02940 [Maribacter algarum]